MWDAPNSPIPARASAKGGSDALAAAQAVIGCMDTPVFLVGTGGTILASSDSANALLALCGLPAGATLPPLLESVMEQAASEGGCCRFVGFVAGRWTRVMATPRPELGGAVVFALSYPLLRDDSDASAIELQHDLGDLERLSVRQAEVLWHLARGDSLPAIAEVSDRSTKTIESHVRALCIHLRTRGKISLARFAWERGFHLADKQRLVRAFEQADRRGRAAASAR